MTKSFLMQYFGLKDADREKYPHLFAFLDQIGEQNG